MCRSSFLVLLGLAVAVGCAAPRQEVCSQRLPLAGERGVVFIADGAGDFRRTSNSLEQAVTEARLPLRVETVEWSHGYGRFLADQLDYSHAQDEGSCLAEEVVAYRRAYPQGRVYLVAHSAGAAVVLSAVQALPANSVEEIVLLAPAVSADYDVRPALRCARRGVDVFSSERDVGFLGAGVAIVGTTDRKWSAAAGRVGFHLSDCPEDAPLYAKLHPHPWEPSVEWTGYRGGHYGAHQPDFLRVYVVPLLAD